MASDNPAKYQYEENALNMYGVGQPRDVLNSIYQTYAANPTGTNPTMQYGLDQMAQFGQQGYLPLYNQGMAQIQAGNVAGNGMLALANQAAPQINMGAVPQVGTGYGVPTALASYDPAFTQAYMNAAPIQQALTASTRDLYSQLGENTLTQIGVNAGQGGNTGSSRRGMAEAIAGRGAMDRAADIAAQMYSAAYGQGAQLGSQYNFANQAAANNMGQFNAGQSLQAQLANQSMYGTLAGQNLMAQLEQSRQAGQNFGAIYQGGLESLTPTFNMGATAPGLSIGAGQTMFEQPWNAVTNMSGALQPWAIPGTSATPGLEQSGWEKAITGINTVGNIMGGVGKLAGGFGW